MSPNQGAQNPSHTYSISGNYNSQLVVTSSNGCKDSTVVTVNVYDNPNISFSVDRENGCTPVCVHFINNSNNPVGTTTYTWALGDGTSTSGNNPSHCYSNNSLSAKTFDVTVSATTNYGTKQCSSSLTQNAMVTVYPLPIAEFDFSPINPNVLNPSVDFMNMSQGGSVWNWNFGDGGTSTQFQPNYTYYNPGVYTVTLSVTGPGGQDIQIQQLIIEVYQVPSAFFTVSPSTVFIPNQPVLFYNLSNFASSYFWDFGDGNTSTDEFPQHFYTQTGVYDIMLIASTPNNCIDTFILSSGVEALSEGGIQIPNAFSPNSSGSNGGLFTGGETDNDVFHPIIIGADEYELNIFNKWGELLFVSTDVNIGWDGYYRNELSKQDVYVYKIKVRFIDGRFETYVGDITLLR